MSQLDNILEKLRRVQQDPDVDDKKGTQPKKYYSGVKKDKKDARDAHFKKGASMSDDNPNAYKEAPGDRDKDGKLKKTKPSKHTNKFKQMYGEAVSPAQQAAIAIAKKKSGKYDKDGKRLEKEACWDGYKQVGLKKKGKKMVPNCVPEMNEKKKDMTAISTWKKNLKKVKGLSKDTMQQLSMLPTPVVTSLINQIGMIVAQYNEELEEETINEKFVRGVRDSEGKTALDRQVDAKKAEIARKRAEIKKREDRAKAERKKKRLAKDRERVAQGKKKTVGTRVRNFFGRESYDVRKYMNLKKQLADLRVKADKAESGGRKDSLMGIQKRMDQIKDKMHKVKYEELGPNADAGDYIDDFRKSDAPQFKGKSDKKIRKMAIAAYLDSKEKK